MISEQKVFRHSTFWTENGILFGRYAGDLVITLEVARQMVADRKDAFGNMYWPLFIDASELLSMDRDARRYLTGKEACDFITAGAIYTKNKVLEVIGNAFVRLDKPIIPAKIFTKKEAALSWLDPYIHKSVILNQSLTGI